MKVEAVIDFADIKSGVKRQQGERFDVTAERYQELNTTRYCQLVREVRTRKPKGE